MREESIATVEKKKAHSTLFLISSEHIPSRQWWLGSDYHVNILHIQSALSYKFRETFIYFLSLFFYKALKRNVVFIYMKYNAIIHAYESHRHFHKDH